MQFVIYLIRKLIGEVTYRVKLTRHRVTKLSSVAQVKKIVRKQVVKIYLWFKTQHNEMRDSEARAVMQMFLDPKVLDSGSARFTSPATLYATTARVSYKDNPAAYEYPGPPPDSDEGRELGKEANRITMERLHMVDGVMYEQTLRPVQI